MNGIGITATLPFLLLRDRRVSGEAKLWWLVIASQQVRPFDNVTIYADDITHLAGDGSLDEVRAWELELQNAGYMRVSAGQNQRSYTYQLLTRRIPPIQRSTRRLLDEVD